MKKILVTIMSLGLLLAGCTNTESTPEPSPSSEVDELLEGEEASGEEIPVELVRPPDITPRGLVAAVIPPMGVFRSNCGATHHAKDDPIVFPGEDRRSHQHGFHGSTAPFTDEDSTGASIMGHGTTCDKPGDQSAYWSPVLVKGDGTLSQGLLLTYYRTAGLLDPTKIVPFPAGFQMVAGSSLATVPQDPEIIAWGCTSGQDNFAVPPVECPVGESLKLKVTFPNCWDGVNLDSPTHAAGSPTSHVAYSWEGDGSKRACPASHPVPLPELQLGFRWNIYSAVDLKGATLTSGSINSGHADFMNGWEPAALAALVKNCLNTPTLCDRGVD